MSTALTLYMMKQASVDAPTTANQLLANTLGGTANNNTSLVGTATGYGELWSQGNAGAWAAAGALSAPTGHGWLWDVTTLEGQQILAGNWTPTFRMLISAGTCTLDVYCRAYVRSSGGVYTQIGSNFLFSGKGLTTANTNVAFSAVSQPLQNFNPGDKLYIDAWGNVTANSSGSGAATLSITMASGSTQGVNNAQLVTPGYQTIPSAHRIVADGYGGVFS